MGAESLRLPTDCWAGPSMNRNPTVHNPLWSCYLLLHSFIWNFCSVPDMRELKCNQEVHMQWGRQTCEKVINLVESVCNSSSVAKLQLYSACCWLSLRKWFSNFWVSGPLYTQKLLRIPKCFCFCGLSLLRFTGSEMEMEGLP